MAADTIPNMLKSGKFILYKSCYYIMWILFLIIVLQKGYTIAAYNTPKELREMNTVAFAYHFAYGKNLYSVSVLENTIPAATNMYGFLIPLILAPFIRLFSFMPLNALQICEALTLIIEIAGALLFYRLLNRKTNHPLLSVIGMLLFYSCYWRYSCFAGAFPDQWGLTVSVILMNILHDDKNENIYHPALYAGMIINLFYIKQYFVLTTIGLCAYLFIYSKKDLKKYLLYGVTFGIISVLLVHYIFPLYFSEVFPIGQGQVLMGDPGYSLKQLIKLSKDYGCMIIFGLFHVFAGIHTMIKKKEMKKEFSYEFCQLVFVLPFLFYIAQNQGTNYTYYLQLWYPYVIAYGVASIPVIGKYVRSIQSKNIRILCSILPCILIMVSFIKIIPFFQCSFMTNEEKDAWRRSYNTLDQYASKGDLLVSMLLSDYCLENNMDTSNYGQAEYNTEGNLQNYKGNKLWRNIFLFDHTEELLQNNISYNAQIRENISRQAYSCIAITYTWEYWISEDELIDAGYHVLTTETLHAGSQCWNVTFYVADNT